MRTRWILLSFALAILFAPFVHGKYAQQQLEKVPIDRVLTNLAARVEDKPDDPAVRFNLARAYAMAYSVKGADVEVRKGKPDELWFGYAPENVPFKAVPTPDKDRQAAAEKQLAQAIEAYEAALKLAPDNLVGRLGYAWALDQSQKKEAAIEQYRKVIAGAWKSESAQKSGGLGHFITIEAGKYLTPLLDPTKDDAELKDIAAKTKTLAALPRAITPLAIPLAADLKAADIEDRRARVTFDADGSGLAKQWSWIKPNAGWLVYDREGTGRIDSALQMFGNVTFWMFWEHGYEPLAALDDNRDGELRGEELQGLAIWCDANQNGLSERGEVRPVASYGIVALAVTSSADAQHPDRIQHHAAGVTFSDGTTRGTYDLLLQRQE